MYICLYIHFFSLVRISLLLQVCHWPPISNTMWIFFWVLPIAVWGKDPDIYLFSNHRDNKSVFSFDLLTDQSHSPFPKVESSLHSWYKSHMGMFTSFYYSAGLDSQRLYDFCIYTHEAETLCAFVLFMIFLSLKNMLGTFSYFWGSKSLCTKVKKKKIIRLPMAQFTLFIASAFPTSMLSESHEHQTSRIIFIQQAMQKE